MENANANEEPANLCAPAGIAGLKNVFDSRSIRPEDIVEYLLQIIKKCNDMGKLEEYLHKINYYLKHKKFDYLREEFGTPP